MGNELLNFYSQLEDMQETKEVTLMKKRVKETLYQELRMHFLEYTKIGRIVGYDELQKELQKAIELLEISKGL